MKKFSSWSGWNFLGVLSAEYDIVRTLQIQVPTSHSIHFGAGSFNT